MNLIFIWTLSMIWQVTAFDMWKVIEEENFGKPSNVTKGGFGGPHSDQTRLVGGDMLTDPEEYRILSASTVNKYPPFYWHFRLWMKRDIPYLITGTLIESHNTEVIKEAMTMISDTSCLTFRKKVESDEHWLEFFVDQGCYSGVGKRYYSSKLPTRISLGKNCVFKSIIAHEIFHALGFRHEQSRYDRDSFINIYTSNIKPSMLDQFDKAEPYESNTVDTPYDYRSIMHYSKKAFGNGKGNVMEAKFDPNQEFGNQKLSSIDIKELNKLYQCHINSGWSEWSGWSACVKSWREDECTKANVRFCISKNESECPGVEDYSVQNQVESCVEGCGVEVIDGVWGNWGEYSKCSGACGWGSQTRYRKCNNPVLSGGGKVCDGSNREKHLCRNPRCSGYSSKMDDSFDDGKFGGWQANGFVLRKGTGPTLNSGPKHDHGIEVTKRNGYYAISRGSNRKYDYITQLSSPYIQPHKSPMCITFYYQLNGPSFRPTDALTFFTQDDKNYIVSFSFKIGGHQGNYWKRKSFQINNRTSKYKFVFEARHRYYQESEIAIDDIFIDHNPCPKGLEGCEDISTDCLTWAKQGQCATHWRKMISECCKTCSDPKSDTFTQKCENQKVSCEKLAKLGECKMNKAWMENNCCKACKEFPNASPPPKTTERTTIAVSTATAATATTPKTTAAESTLQKIVTTPKRLTVTTEKLLTTPSCDNKNKYCGHWVKNGECTKAFSRWMKINCCKGCRNVLPATTPSRKRKDGQWGRWEQYSKCSGSCGWGSQIRYRKCNKPAPLAGGKDCVGLIKESHICRNKKCKGYASALDTSFDKKSFGTWEPNGFILRTGSNTTSSNGPSVDHTYEVTGEKGYFAAATTLKRPPHKLTSLYVKGHIGAACLSFNYWLNGTDLHPTAALYGHMLDADGRFHSLFRMGGHKGNYWKRRTIQIKPMKTKYKIVILSNLKASEQAEVGIDDIFYDPYPCPLGLEECKDLYTNCEALAAQSKCKSQWRTMLAVCCKTCSAKE